MLLEAWMIDSISKNGFEGEKYDYVTHQVIASPFKPLAYIDKMDILHTDIWRISQTQKNQ